MSYIVWGTIFIYSRDENGLCSWCEAIFIVMWSNFYQERKPSNFVENSLRSCLLCFFSCSPYFYNLFASFIFPFSFLSTCTSLFVIRLFSLIAYISYLIILCASSYSSSSFCLLFLLLTWVRRIQNKVSCVSMVLCTLMHGFFGNKQ